MSNPRHRGRAAAQKYRDLFALETYNRHAGPMDKKVSRHKEKVNWLHDAELAIDEAELLEKEELKLLNADKLNNLNSLLEASVNNQEEDYV